MKLADLHNLINGHRNAPPADIITRAAALVPSTLNDKSRSVRCTLASEAQVPVYDWQSGRVVLEVLVVSGCQYEDQTPLLRDHNQYSVTSILGSITEVTAERDELVGLLTFGEDLDDTAEAIWKRVKQGHLRKVSVGYGYTRKDFTTIPAGRTADIAGRSWTAPDDRDLRVVTRWKLREVSVVVIPADDRAQMRDGQTPSGSTLPDPQRGTPGGDPTDFVPRDPSAANPNRNHPSSTEPEPKNPPMNELIRFLRSHGLAETVTENEAALAWARSNLGHEHVARLGELCRELNLAFDPIQYRQAPPAPPTPTPPTNPPVDPVAAERQRQSAIRSLAADFPQVPAATVTRCLDEGLTLDQTRAQFLDAIRGSSQPPVPPVAPAGHIKGGITLRALQAGLMLREGLDPDSPALRARESDLVTSRREFNADWLRGAGRTGEARDAVEQAFDDARRLRLQNGSLMRFCEAIVELNGDRAPWNEDELLERAFSSGDFSAVFGSVVHMSMVAGYTETPATYEEFCRVVDVPDFRKNQEAMVNGVGRLKKQGKPGGQAALLNVEDPTLAEYAAERYAGILKISDQTIINDTFGITGQLPREVGISARQIPTDLVYAILLGNPNLSDGSPLFIADTNMLTAAMDEAGLASAGVMLKNKKIGNKRIVITDGVLLHGTTLSVAARKLINNQTKGGDENVMRNAYRRVEDTAVDLGVSNPATDPETIVAGKPGSYWLFAKPARSFVVAFRKGTNRGPITRTAKLDKGEFGVCWDVVIDVGAAATSRIGVVQANTSS